MLYLNSKGEQKKLEEMNDFELTATAKKADRVLNWATGRLSEGYRGDSRESEDALRYIKVVRDNLWEEVKRRDLDNPVKAHFHETFPHLEEGDKKALWNFMKTNFSPKQ